MSKHILGWILATGVMFLPGQEAWALTSPWTEPAQKTLQAVHQTMSHQVSIAAQNRSYTIKKYGLTLTLLSNWKRVTTPANSIFAAQPADNNGAVIMLSTIQYKTQKQASTAHSNLRSKSKEFGAYLLTSFQQQFPTGTCTLSSAGKKTLGGKLGARAIVDCPIEGTVYSLSVFAFVHKLNYYAVTYMVPQSQFKGLLTQMDKITASIKFTK